jgi:hypothetical protein
MGISKLIVGLVVVGVAVAAGVLLMMPGEPAAASGGRQGPPANAVFVEEPPELIVGALATARPGARQGVIDYYVGQWVPAEGWEGVVESITREREGPALRIHRPSTAVGGGCWIIALVEPDHGITIGERVWVQGAIRDVKIQQYGPAIAMHVVLEEARVVMR